MLGGGGKLAPPGRVWDDAAMNRPHIESLTVERYGCVQQCTVALTPLHALVGPNDSGKSTLLTALATMGAWATGLDDPERIAARDALTARFERGGDGARLAVTTNGFEWDVRVSRAKASYVLPGDLSWSEVGKGTPATTRVVGESPGQANLDTLRAALQGLIVLRLDPDALRRPAALIPEGQPVRLRDDRGTGLPGVLDALQARNADTIAELNARMRALFPTFKSLRLRNTSAHEKALGITLQDGVEVGADEMSEGMLYFLALATLEYIDAAPIVLIEEPENGLHPARIAEVMRLFRRLSERTQIVLATHSPLVVNELEGHEISVVTRPPQLGTQVVRLSDTPGYAMRSHAYANGELWLNYCNGVDEAALLNGGPAP